MGLKNYTDEYGRFVTIKNGKHYFNERTGGNRGRLHDDQFSIKGRSWDYRDPRNIAESNSGEEIPVTVNPESDRMFDELYDYGFGRVRDAARALDIVNVDEQQEVDDILKYIRTGKSGQKDDDEKPEYVYEPTPLPKDPYEEEEEDVVITQPVIGPSKPLPKPGDFGPERPPGSIGYIPPSTPEGEAAYGKTESGESDFEKGIRSIADFGNRSTDDYFGRFLPEMSRRNVNEARATGRSLLSNIQRFQGKVPELGDPKDLFEFYLGKIKD